MQGLNSTARSY